MAKTVKGSPFLIGAALLLLLFVATAIAGDDGASRLIRPESVSPQPPAVTKDPGANDYDGYLKVYVIEPVSRYNDAYGHAYEFGFLDHAIDMSVSIPLGTPFSTTATWDASAEGFGTIAEGNIMVIATLQTGEGKPADGNPGEAGGDYTAYYEDAVAYAYPGTTGSDTASGDYTHTVFVGEGTWVG